MQTLTPDLFPQSLLVARSGERIYTTSRKVATHFGKNHRDVLKAIKNLLAELSGIDFEASTERNFALSSYTDSTGRSLPEYHLSHDGFALLAMGFTGREALRWKVAFLAAFRQMERDLAQMQARYVAALDTIRPKLRPVVQDFADGMARSDTALWLGCSVASVSYQRSQARRLGLLAPAASVGGAA